MKEIYIAKEPENIINEHLMMTTFDKNGFSYSEHAKIENKKKNRIQLDV